MGLLLCLCAYFEPDHAKLGSDDYQTREYWSQRYENWFSALLLPKVESDDPEVRLRVARIRAHTRWLDTVYWERVIRHHDWELWLRMYVVHGESRTETLRETYEDLRRDSSRAKSYMLATTRRDLLPPFLRGRVFPHEFDDWLRHRMIYRHKLMFWPVAHSAR